MNQPTSFTSTSDRVKITGPQVVEFTYCNATYMVSPHAERSSALALNLQGQSLVIPVATLSLARGHIAEIEWETPFNGHTEEWQTGLITIAAERAQESTREIS